MSIVLMSAAFKAQIKSTPKLVLLALADCANDQGECYPSVPTLMEKCSSGERTVQDAVAYLEREGFIRREFRTGRSTVYWINDPRNWRTPAESAPPQTAHPTPADAAPPPPQIPHPTPAVAAPITIKEPSIEPSRKQKTRERAPEVECPEGVTADVWADWLRLRKGKNAVVTGTVVRGAMAEARKAGMSLNAFFEVWCLRGSQGLQADWLKPEERNRGSPMTAAERRVLQAVPSLAAPHLRPQQPTFEVFDVDAKQLG